MWMLTGVATNQVELYIILYKTVFFIWWPTRNNTLFSIHTRDPQLLDTYFYPFPCQFSQALKLSRVVPPPPRKLGQNLFRLSCQYSRVHAHHKDSHYGSLHTRDKTIHNNSQKIPETHLMDNYRNTARIFQY